MYTQLDMHQYQAETKYNGKIYLHTRLFNQNSEITTSTAKTSDEKEEWSNNFKLVFLNLTIRSEVKHTGVFLNLASYPEEYTDGYLLTRKNFKMS